MNYNTQKANIDAYQQPWKPVKEDKQNQYLPVNQNNSTWCLSTEKNWLGKK
jgi:hypothetical protein